MTFAVTRPNRCAHCPNESVNIVTTTVGAGSIKRLCQTCTDTHVRVFGDYVHVVAIAAPIRYGSR